MTTHTDLIKTLQSKIDAVLLPYASLAKNIILLDFPNHKNVGDSAIYLGTLHFFRQTFGKRPSIVSEWSNLDWSLLDRSNPGDPIFLHGGANFGDIWPHHQEFREAILKRYPGRLVVQLPQSIYYSDEAHIARAAQAIKDNGNFVLLVRDERSYEISKKHFPCEVHRCPDMAFYLGALSKPVAPSHPLLLLMRTDKEAHPAITDIAQLIPSGVIKVDWLNDSPSMIVRMKSKTLITALFNLSLDKMIVKERYYDYLTIDRLQRGTSLLSSARFVVTDRLHAHILSLLLNIPHIVLDNSYGKIAGFMNLWTKDYDHVRRATGLSAAIEMCNDKLR